MDSICKMSVGNKALSRLDLKNVYKIGTIRKLSIHRLWSRGSTKSCWHANQHSALLKISPSSLVTKIKTLFCFKWLKSNLYQQVKVLHFCNFFLFFEASWQKFLIEFLQVRSCYRKFQRLGKGGKKLITQIILSHAITELNFTRI